MDGDIGTGSSGSSTTARPGTQFFAPQARLVTEDGGPLLLDDQPISPDIVSVTATLVNTGVSQVDVVLNNQRHDESNRPVVPPWRYNALSKVGFGKRVRVDFRYGNEGWTPMILARITDVQFLFPSAAGSHVTLKGEDLLSLLKANPAEDVIYRNPPRHEMEMVEAELSASGSGLSLPSPRPANEFSNPLPAVTHEKAKTYLQFVDSLAERMDYEVFVAFDNLDPGRSGRGAGQADARPVSFHFEPARSATLDKFVTLRWGRDIIDFKPAFKVWEVLTEAVASGSVPRGRGTFSTSVQTVAAVNDLHSAPEGDSPAAAPIDAATARSSSFSGENRPEVNSEQLSVTNIDEERATAQATATLRRSARTFLTAEITTIGGTATRPGMHVNLEGFYAPFDGIYYITKAVHSITAAGYITKLSVRRPGMLDPSSYPGN